MLLTIAPPPAPIIHDAQVAVLSQLPAELGSYFKYYCVAIAPGTLSPPITRASRLESVQMQADPPSAVLSRLKMLSRQFVANSECGRTEADWDVFHRPTKAKPAILIAVGQVEVVSSTHIRVVVLTTSGFLTETYTLYDLERDDAGWRITASVIVLQA